MHMDGKIAIALLTDIRDELAGQLKDFEGGRLKIYDGLSNVTSQWILILKQLDTRLNKMIAAHRDAP